MVNREKRDVAARAIERVIDGTLEGSRFLDKFPHDRRDRALAAIYERLWLCFDDRRPEPFAKNRADYEEIRQLLERCRDFLLTNLDYHWPSSFKAPVKLILLRLIGARSAVSRIEQQQLQRMNQVGDIREWPFLARQNDSE